MKVKKLMVVACVACFVITTLTSVPLFVNYLLGNEVSNTLIIDLHSWFGAFFILIAGTRMIKNKAFMEQE